MSSTICQAKMLIFQQLILYRDTLSPISWDNLHLILWQSELSSLDRACQYLCCSVQIMKNGIDNFYE